MVDMVWGSGTTLDFFQIHWEKTAAKPRNTVIWISGLGEVKPNEDWPKEGINQQKQEHISRMVQYPSWNRLMV